MAAQPDYPLLSIEEFLDINFGDQKAELEDGVIRMMAGAKARHNRVVSNLITALNNRLEGTGCSAYGPDMGVRTRARTLRYPDVTVLCGHDGEDDDDARLFDDPRVVFEVLSAGTSRTDLKEKLPEYQALPSVDTIVFVDVGVERLRIAQRNGPDEWSDRLAVQEADLPLPSLGIDLPLREIFRRR